MTDGLQQIVNAYWDRRYRDRDGAEGGDANAAPVPQDRQARAEGIAQGIPANPLISGVSNNG